MKNLYYNNNLFSGIIFIILGLILLFNPEVTLIAIVYYIGISKIISGALGLFSNLKKETKDQLDFGINIMYILFGSMLILSPLFSTLLISIVPIIIGFWAAIVGSMHAINSFKYKGIVKRWWIFLILGLATAGFGVFIILNPIEVVADLIILIGSFYLLIGCFVIYNFIMDKRNENPDVIG